MSSEALPILFFALGAAALSIGMLVAGLLFGPRHSTPVKGMPYESGVDPVHSARRRFDVRFYLVAIAFVIFDVELLFLYPWAVASGNAQGIDKAVREGLIAGRGLVFGEVMFFIALLSIGLVYVWRRGIFRWR